MSKVQGWISVLGGSSEFLHPTPNSTIQGAKSLLADVPLSLPSALVSPGHTVVGYQFHYFSYCTWKGRIVFGEDLYVMPEFRGRGSVPLSLPQLALAHGCTQFRFVSANWNQPATALYEKLGAVDVTARDNWVVWHIEGRAVRELAERATQ
uniref:N-acetyltransferase domain-containing protein n=1 Tax=Terrapene triunguis TaxID=2587831 RepID=A0A674K7P6_9SAUR